MNAVVDADEALARALERQLEAAYGPGVRVRDLRALSMGASKETRRFTAMSADGHCHELILRRDPVAEPEPERMAREAAILRAAAAQSLPVPPLICHGDGRAGNDSEAGIGAPFIIMAYQGGESIPRRILRDAKWSAVRARLARRLGQVAGQIHQIPLDTLGTLVADDPLAHWLREYREYRESGPPSPAFELARHWLVQHRPAPGPTALVHGDFRLGNLIVEGDDIAAVLDWELAYSGDPIADLGWVCVKAWRFGGALPVAGVGDIEDLLAGYRETAGWAPTPEALHWWMVFGLFRWGIMCRRQARRHLSGQAESLELAAVGRRFAENEHDLLMETGYATPTDLESRLHPEPAEVDEQLGSPDAPTLLAAARDLLKGQGNYESRVAAQVLETLRREAVLGASLRGQVDARLRRAGVRDEQELAARIREQNIPLDDAVRQAVRAGVDARLQVWNPKYLIS